MRLGLICSILLHVAILAWAVFTIQSQREIRAAEPDPVVVDLVTESDLTRLRQGSRTAKQREAQPKEAPKSEPAKKQAAKPKPAAAAPPPPPPPPEEPPPPPKEAAKAKPKVAPAPPAPSLDEQKKLAALLKEEEHKAEVALKRLEEERKADEQRKAEEERKAEQKRKAEEEKKAEEKKRLEEEKQRKKAEAKKKRDEQRRKKLAERKKKREEERKRKEAEAKKKQFDAEKIAALLNKVPDKGAPPQPSAPPKEPTKAKGPALGAPEGRDQRISASEIAIIGQIIKSCVQSKWNVLGGGELAQHTNVKIRLRFHADGRLASAPEVMNPQNTAYFLAVQDSALRAVRECEPYPLPAAKYDIWKDIVLNFDPRDMF